VVVTPREIAYMSPWLGNFSCASFHLGAIFVFVAAQLSVVATKLY
jgi:hypothetical protein